MIRGKVVRDNGIVDVESQRACTLLKITCSNLQKVNIRNIEHMKSIWWAFRSSILAARYWLPWSDARHLASRCTHAVYQTRTSSCIHRCDNCKQSWASSTGEIVSKCGMYFLRQSNKKLVFFFVCKLFPRACARLHILIVLHAPHVWRRLSSLCDCLSPFNWSCQIGEEAQQSVIRKVFQQVAQRPDSFCNYLDGSIPEWGEGVKLIYRHYATLYFVFAVDQQESDLGILDLIQGLTNDRNHKCENHIRLFAH